MSESNARSSGFLRFRILMHDNLENTQVLSGTSRPLDIQWCLLAILLTAHAAEQSAEDNAHTRCRHRLAVSTGCDLLPIAGVFPLTVRPHQSQRPFRLHSRRGPTRACND